MSAAARPPRGRRPGSPDTREEILTAAREAFAEHGSKASVRQIAGAAGVDAALVHHYFGTKDELFLQALRLPLDPRELLTEATVGPTEQAGERLLTAFLSVWDDPELQPSLLALARTLAEPQGRELIRNGFVPMVIAPVVDRVAPDRPGQRLPLVASQLVGLIVARYLLGLQPLASAPAAEVVSWIAPNLQRYLTGPLD